MPRAQQFVSAAVALLVVVGIVVMSLNLRGDGIEAGASDSPSPSVAASPTQSGAPIEQPSPADGEDAHAVLAEIEEQVVGIRGLPAVDLEPELLTRDQLRDELLLQFEEDYPPEEVAADNATLRALGLLDADQDIADLQLQLLGDQVLGFYNKTGRRMVIVTDEGLNPLAKFTYAHEYTHALQDAAFGLASLGIEEEGQDDQALARLALVEGDATATMLAWAFTNLEPAELAEITNQPLPDTSGIPSWLVEQLVVFPYSDGLTWTSALTGIDPTRPDFAEVDAAFGNPPDSTEQIIDLAKWQSREPPVAIEPFDLAATMGGGWSEVADTPIGQAFIRMMLEYHGVAREEALDASAGWGGDRVVVAIGPGGGFAVAWRLAWDTATDAEEFLGAYETAIANLDFPASVTQPQEGEVLVAHGSSAEILRRAIDAGGG